MNIVAFLASALFPLAATQAGEPQKPNLIVIYTDDHGWADLGAQGVRQDVRTPHLDALAAGGVRATNGYVTAPQCVPSRGGLLVGKFQGRFNLDSNGSSDPAGMTEFSGELYFSATTPASGRELWKVNSLGVPTQVTELEPSGSSDPAEFTVFNNELYFVATTTGNGRTVDLTWNLRYQITEARTNGTAVERYAYDASGAEIASPVQRMWLMRIGQCLRRAEPRLYSHQEPEHGCSERAGP